MGVADGSGFRADARFFTGPQGGGGTFAGESTKFFDAAAYADGQWHTFTTQVVVPNGTPIGDVRFSTYFGPFTGGQVLIDNVSLNRPVVAGDFDADGDVDHDDLGVWQSEFGVGAGGDADGDGDTDGNDLLAWQRNLGASSIVAASAAGANVAPEPSGAWCALVGVACLAFFQR